jgi:SAM-dependent methyltransferase
MSATAAVVVGSYRSRAAWARAESRPTTPHLLAGALDGVTAVVEFPAGPGHFLTHYARAGARVHLIDASWPMLAAATHHARDVGVAELAIGCHFLEQLPDLAGEELVVVPNAALNQLAAQAPLPDVLARLRRAVKPGTRLLLQYLTGGAGPGHGPCGFYDPALPDGRTATDHTFSAPDGRPVTRRHRQHHAPDRARVRIEFAYTSPGRAEPTASVHLALPTAAQVQAALAATGWTTARTHTHAGFREVLATAGGGR